MRKVLILLIYFIPIALQNSAQNFTGDQAEYSTGIIDSLKRQLTKTKEDTVILKILNSLSKELQSGSEYDKAMKYATEAKNRSEKILKENPDGKETETITKELGRAFVNMGAIATYSGNYTEGLKNYLAALNIFEQIDNTRGIASCYINMGVIYFYQGNNNEALKNYFNGLKLYEVLGDQQKIAIVYNNVGGIYVNQQNYTEALKNLFAALKISEQTGDEMGMAHSYNNIGEAYFKQGNYEEALKSHLATLSIMDKVHDQRGIILSHNNIGSDYTALGKYDEAISYLSKGLELANEMNYKEMMKDIYLSFSDVYQKLNDFKNAFKYHKLYSGLKDSLANENTGAQMAEMKAKYETEKKDKEIALLNKDKEIQAMKIGKQRTTLNYLVGVFASLILFSVIAFRLYSQKKKTAFERRVSETELKALRSQMNPHFTFNVLNSIQYYIGGNDMKSAELYLNKFSRLIRMILDQSRIPYISLQQEIHMLKLYIELEEMLFENKFSYKMEIDQNLDPEKILIPGMLIQPIVENAIKHGIEHKKGKALINISLSSRNSTLLCNVTDNGIGRQAAEKLKGEKVYKSVATSIIRERMETLSMLYDIVFEYKTVDLFDDNGKPCGTTVFMEIPFKVMQS